MSYRYLTESEKRVLAALAGGLSRFPTELAAELELHVQLVRGALRQLRGTYRLVEPGVTWGSWRISDTGRRELASWAQTELPI